MKLSVSQLGLRVALVYDRVNSQGGAERVLMAFHKLYPQAPLFTSVYESACAPWAKDWDVRTSFIQSIPWLRSRHQLVGWLMPFAFESFDFSDFDLIISVTSEYAKAIITRPEQLHISYLLTPTRYVWSHKELHLEYVPRFLRGLARRVFLVLQRYDWVAARRPDLLVTISQLVKSRVKKYYELPARVIYPPFEELPKSVKPKAAARFPQYLITWGRLVKYKRFDLTLRAACDAKLPLLIIGDGPEKKSLQILAQELDPQGQYIQFIDRCSDAELSWYLENARVAVFAQVEDFGISPLEALLAGCPVVVQRESGSSELLDHSSCAYFLDGENDENFSAVLLTAWNKSTDRLDIQRQARQYAGERWSHEWVRLVDETLRQHSLKVVPQQKANRKGL